MVDTFAVSYLLKDILNISVPKSRVDVDDLWIKHVSLSTVLIESFSYLFSDEDLRHRHTVIRDSRTLTPLFSHSVKSSRYAVLSGWNVP